MLLFKHHIQLTAYVLAHLPELSLFIAYYPSHTEQPSNNNQWNQQVHLSYTPKITPWILKNGSPSLITIVSLKEHCHMLSILPLHCLLVVKNYTLAPYKLVLASSSNRWKSIRDICSQLKYCTMTIKLKSRRLNHLPVKALLMN